MIIIKQISFTGNIDWNLFIEKSKTATFFQTKAWLSLWVKHFGGEVIIWGVYDVDELIGIAPFRKSENTLSFLGVDPVLGKELVSDFGDIIIVEGREEEVWETIIEKFQILPPSGGIPLRRDKFQIPKLEFNFIREDSPSFHILQSKIGDGVEIDTAPYIDLPKTWDEYLGLLDRHDRHEIKRKIRRLEEEKAFKICHEGDPSDIEEFFRLMKLSSDEKVGFLTKEMENFFRGIISTFKSDDKMNLCFMKLYGINIASTLSFVFNDSIYLYNSGFDPEYNRLSPGLTLKVFLIKHAIEEGRTRFEFLRGGEKYKYGLGGKERKLYKFTLGI